MISERKEETAEEWLNFLNACRKAGGEALLKDEHAYLEAYFKTMEGGNMYVHMFFACMRECIDLSRGDIMDCLLYLDNMEDAVR